ncbi:MAG: hypothetical protein Q4A07_04640 [Coriobacteriales bacterium]|nr:hypothetical protein [Coriobacteriales bacterium]
MEFKGLTPEQQEKIKACKTPEVASNSADARASQTGVMHSANPFWDLEASLGEGLGAFKPDLRPTSEILEEAEWELLEEKELV